ncbi:MAG: hypothetical protein WD271_17795 [Acidimicrobiia bacterium]
MITSHPLRAIAGVAIALGVLAVAPPAFAATTPTTTRPAQKAFNAYRSCMKAHGVKLTVPTGGRNNPDANPPGGVPPNGAAAAASGSGSGTFVPPNLPKGVTLKKYQAAQKACQSKLPAGGFGGSGGAQSGQFQAYLSCLGDHGVKVPSSAALRNLDRNDPTFQAADQICGALLPDGAAPPGNATSTPSGNAT